MTVIAFLSVISSFCFEEGIPTLREVGDLPELATILCKRGEHAHRRGDETAALESLAEAEEIAQSLGTPPGSELARSIAHLRLSLAN